jgi:hypothetical protein
VHSAFVLQTWTCWPVHVALHSVEAAPPAKPPQQMSVPVQSAFSSQCSFAPFWHWSAAGWQPASPVCFTQQTSAGVVHDVPPPHWTLFGVELRPPSAPPSGVPPSVLLLPSVPPSVPVEPLVPPLVPPLVAPLVPPLVPVPASPPSTLLSLIVASVDPQPPSAPASIHAYTSERWIVAVARPRCKQRMQHAACRTRAQVGHLTRPTFRTRNGSTRRRRRRAAYRCRWCA